MNTSFSPGSLTNTRRLLEIVARLRDPERGCPWDREQNFESLSPYLLEEAYEVRDAIERQNTHDLQEELGDLLLQIAFHSRIAEEQGLFDFDAVAAEICAKLVRRHPHVFGDLRYETNQQRVRAWEAAKAEERRKKPQAGRSALDGIASALPALMFAAKMQQRASRHGFDWPEAAPVFDKVEEELEELREAYQSGDQANIREELGDLLFVTVNLARHLGVEPENALHHASRKFERRFRYIEQQVAEQGRQLDECALQELDALWEEAKIVLKPAS
ncbi:MAG: nucleoside triphosphate pyrophosphohydrolase [Methylococcaceae bacterium]|nr:nucleoside triphosphate pyrophosphohydrolase [Methylococcaceae bacterium]MCI0667781.1 nucleoside triphosphate pyrophosphohydrolase [Methylococcaceae bacterium]